MAIRINLLTGNDAFLNNECQEVARILTALASKLRTSCAEGLSEFHDTKLMDLNGGVVGEVLVADDDSFTTFEVSPDDTYKEHCTRCGEERTDVEERYSFGEYAGRLCVPCCGTYRDHCGIDQDQGDPTTLDEYEAGGMDAITGEDY